MLTKQDLQDIKKLLKPIYEFIAFAQPAIESLLDESQDNFKQHLPERLKKLEEIHPQLHVHHLS